MSNRAPIPFSENWLDDSNQESQVRHIESEIPLKRPPQYGVCLWWSDELPSWIHPDDVEAADQLVPGNRIFRREDCPNFADRKLGYSLMSYGPHQFRALPAIWLPIGFEGFEIGDRVEIKSQLGRATAMICTIREVRWNRHQRRINYWVNSVTTNIRSGLFRGRSTTRPAAGWIFERARIAVGSPFPNRLTQASGGCPTS